MRMKAGTQAIRALLYLASGYVDRATLGEAGAQEMVDLLTPLALALASAGQRLHQSDPYQVGLRQRGRQYFAVRTLGRSVY
jgi:hypothetical protein